MRTPLALICIFASLGGFVWHNYPDRCTDAWADFTGGVPSQAVPATNSSATPPILALQTTATVVPPADQVKSGIQVVPGTPNNLVATTEPAPITAPLPLPVLPASFTTTDGKTYCGVKLIKLEDDAITIMHQDGGALVPLKNCSLDIQILCRYDANKATVATAQRVKDEAKSQNSLSIERQQIDQANQARLLAQAQQTAKDQAAYIASAQAANATAALTAVLAKIKALQADIVEAQGGVYANADYKSEVSAQARSHRAQRINQDNADIATLQGQAQSLGTTTKLASP